jgi:1-acyl-sn-glycerol-3-phosphate acyltransferase
MRFVFRRLSMFRALVTVLFVFAFMIMSLVLLPVMWVVSKINPSLAEKQNFAIVMWGFRVIRAVSGSKMHVSGQENIPEGQSVIFAGNHQSYFDIILGYPYLPVPTAMLAKIELKKFPIVSNWMKRIHCIFIDRKDPRQAIKAISEASEDIKNNKTSVMIFPEGTRSKDGEVHEFKTGSLKVATKANCPIIPVAFRYSDSVWEKHYKKLVPQDVYITFLPPVIPGELDKEEKKHIGDVVREKIVSYLKSTN